MTTASPAIQLSADGASWLAPGAVLQIAAGAAFYARLNSIANVDSTTWLVISTDDVGSAPALTPSGIVNSQATGTGGAAGTCFILQSTINGGTDKTTNTPNALTTTATVIVEVLAANGLAVIAFDEHAEHGAQWWLPKVNAAIRAASAGASAGLGTNVRNVNHASSPVTAVAGDYIRCDTSGGTIAITVPSALRSKVSVKKLTGDANSITLTPDAGTIDGAATQVISVQYAVLTTVGIGSGGCDIFP